MYLLSTISHAQLGTEPKGLGRGLFLVVKFVFISENASDCYVPSPGPSVRIETVVSANGKVKDWASHIRKEVGGGESGM